MHRPYRVLLTQKAKRDIVSISNYIAQMSMDDSVAEQWMRSVHEHILILQDFPESYPRLAIPPYRRMLHGKYLVLYRVDLSSLTVVVCRVVHTARLLENIGDLE